MRPSHPTQHGSRIERREQARTSTLCCSDCNQRRVHQPGFPMSCHSRRRIAFWRSSGRSAESGWGLRNPRSLRTKTVACPMSVIMMGQLQAAASAAKAQRAHACDAARQPMRLPIVGFHQSIMCWVSSANMSLPYRQSPPQEVAIAAQVDQIRLRIDEETHRCPASIRQSCRSSRFWTVRPMARPMWRLSWRQDSVTATWVHPPFPRPRCPPASGGVSGDCLRICAEAACLSNGSTDAHQAEPDASHARRMHGTQGGLDFQDLLEQHPDAVMEYIVKHGTKLLGTFKCKVTMPCGWAHA